VNAARVDTLVEKLYEFFSDGRLETDASLTNYRFLFLIVLERLVALFARKPGTNDSSVSPLLALANLLDPPMRVGMVKKKYKLLPTQYPSFEDIHARQKPFIRTTRKINELMILISHRVKPVCTCPSLDRNDEDYSWKYLARSSGCRCHILTPESKFTLRYFREGKYGFSPLRKFNSKNVWVADALDEEIQDAIKRLCKKRDRSSITLFEVALEIYKQRGHGIMSESLVDKHLEMFREFESRYPEVREMAIKQSLLGGVELPLNY
jgi:hypothetical protein